MARLAKSVHFLLDVCVTSAQNVGAAQATTVRSCLDVVNLPTIRAVEDEITRSQEPTLEAHEEMRIQRGDFAERSLHAHD